MSTMRQFVVVVLWLAMISLVSGICRGQDQAATSPPDPLLSSSRFSFPQAKDKNLAIGSRGIERFLGWKHKSKDRAAYLHHFLGNILGRQRPALSGFSSSSSRSAGTPLSAAQVPSAPFLKLRDALPAGFIPTGITTGDFDGDGKMDWVVSNGGEDSLWYYHGRGDGTADLPVIIPLSHGTTPLGVKAADLRGIGVLDLVVPEIDNQSVGVLLGNGDGTFAPEKTYLLPTAPTFVTTADINHDGNLDVIVGLDYSNGGNSLISQFVVLPGDGKGNLQTPLPAPGIGRWNTVQWISVTDANRDGNPDLIVTSDIGTYVYIGNGDFTFTLGQKIVETFGTTQVYSAEAADLNGDGCPDVLVSSGAASVYLGNCSGVFTFKNSYPLGDLGWGLALKDVNGDGKLDVITSGVGGLIPHWGGTASFGGDLVSVLLGDGNGGFGTARVYRAELSMFSLAVADLKGDGKLDVLTANQDSNTVSVLMNDGQGGFGDPQGLYFGGNNPTTNVTAADVNGDGKPDILISDIESSLSGYSIVDSGYIFVALNQGNGTFSTPIRSTIVTGAPGNIYSGNFLLGDFRNSGTLDIVTADATPGFSPFFSFSPNMGNGSFGAPVRMNSYSGASVLAKGDFDHNGKLDLVTTGYNAASGSYQLIFLSGNGDGTFHQTGTTDFGRKPSAGDGGIQVFTGDFNGDGNPDVLAVINLSYGLHDVYEFLGNGDGTFQPATLMLSGVGNVKTSDFNGDGRSDIIELGADSSGYSAFKIYLAQPDGSFQLANSYVNSQAAVVDYGIGDFNGDGKTDILAIEAGGFGKVDLVVQILPGNGDGTFTLTSDIAELKQQFQQNLEIADIYGNGHAGLICVDTLTSSFHFIPTAPAPAFQMRFLAQPAAGANGKVRISLNVTAANDTIINLSASDSEITVPASVTLPAGTQSLDVAYSIGSNFDLTHVFSISGQLGSEVETAYNYFTGHVIPAGVELQLTFAGESAIQGQSTPNYHLQLNSLFGYASTLHLQCSGLPAQASCQFGQNPILLPEGGGTSSSLIVSTGNGTPTGTYQFTITASDDYVSSSINATLIVTGYLQLMPPGNPISFKPGLDFGPVSIGKSSLPAAIQVWNSNSIPVSSIVFSTTDSEYTLGGNCGSTLAPNSSCTVNVTFAPSSPGQHDATLQVTYAGLNGSETLPMTGSGVAGAATLYPANVVFPDTALGSSVSAVPPLVFYNYSDATVSVTGTSMSDTAFTADATSCQTVAPHSSCAIQVRFVPGQPGTVNATYTVSFSGATGSPVNATLSGTGHGVSLAVSNPQITVFPEQTAVFSGTVTPLGGPQDVAVQCDWNAPWICQGQAFSPATGPEPFSVLAAGTAAQDYSFNVNAYGHFGSSSQAVTLHVVDFDLHRQQPFSIQKVFRGSSLISQLDLSSVNGFSGPVVLSCGSLPVGITCSFAPGAVVTLAPGTSVPVTLTVAVADSAPIGASMLNLSATATANGFLRSREQLYNLDIIDFSLGPPSTPTLNVIPGNPSAPFTLQVSSLGNFAGSVNLSCSGLPTGAACMFLKNSSMTLGPNSTATTQLVVLTSGATSVGNYQFTISANSSAAPAPRVQTVNLDVTAGSGTVDLSVGVNHQGTHEPVPVGAQAVFNVTAASGQTGDPTTASLSIVFSGPVTFGILPPECVPASGPSLSCSFEINNGSSKNLVIPVIAPFTHDLAMTAFLSSSAVNTNSNNIGNDEAQVRPRPLLVTPRH
jgi:hypothetical protein